MTALDDAKRAMRAEAWARRALVDPQLSAVVCAVLGRDVNPLPGAVIAGYWPIGDEVDVRPALLAWHDEGHAIALPATPPLGQPLTFHRWRPGAAMRAERFGTSRPAVDERLVPTVVLVPLLAFDRAGRRLGYGGGYYDRTLPGLPPGATIIGCAYATQEVTEVPAGDRDIRLPRVATEVGLLVCRAEPAG